jgi:hypothetical protein
VGILPDRYGCYSDGRVEVYNRLSPYIEWIKNVTNSSITTYSSLNNNNDTTSSTITTSSFTTSSNQPRNNLNLILEIISLLIVMFL